MLLQIFITIITSLLLFNFSPARLSVLADNDYETIIEKQVTRHFPVRKPETVDVVLEARSSAVLDVKENLFMYENNANEVSQIASISKLMTALVVMEQKPNWALEYEVQRTDRREGGKIYLYLGEKVTVKDLFYAMLVGSDNTATISLINSLGFTEEQFVEKMNAKAQALGLLQTKFQDATGLSNENVSTAREVVQLAKMALDNPEISTAVNTKQYKFSTLNGRPKTIDSTNSLLDNFSDNGVRILGGKTGHTELAGYCLVAKFVDQNKHEIITVVLNTKSENERFHQTAKLVDWVFTSFNW